MRKLNFDEELEFWIQFYDAINNDSIADELTDDQFFDFIHIARDEIDLAFQSVAIKLIDQIKNELTECGFIFESYELRPDRIILIEATNNKGYHTFNYVYRDNVLKLLSYYSNPFNYYPLKLKKIK